MNVRDSKKANALPFFQRRQSSKTLSISLFVVFFFLFFVCKACTQNLISRAIATIQQIKPSHHITYPSSDVNSFSKGQRGKQTETHRTKYTRRPTPLIPPSPLLPSNLYPACPPPPPFPQARHRTLLRTHRPAIAPCPSPYPCPCPSLCPSLCPSP